MNEMELIKNINVFMKQVSAGNVSIYNEFSFQHELGFFLRTKFPSRKIEFERNISHYRLQKQQFVKREIDISIVDRKTNELLGVVELKYPRNGQVLEQMYSFCKDISFIEQLVLAGFKYGAFVVVVDDPRFYSGKIKGIYYHV